MVTDPTLKAAVVSFHTTTDDKDNNTHVTITVRDRAGSIAARLDDDLGHFNNSSDNGPYALRIINTSERSKLETGNVTMRIDPSGDDTWVCNVFLDLIFSDDSHRSGSADNLTFNNEEQQQTFGIQ